VGSYRAALVRILRRASWQWKAIVKGLFGAARGADRAVERE